MRQAARELHHMVDNAPHLLTVTPFIVPCRSVIQTLGVYIKMKMLDLYSLGYRLGPSKFVYAPHKSMPLLKSVGYGVMYHDVHVDDRRYVLSLAMSAALKGCVVVPYLEVTKTIQAGVSSPSSPSRVVGVHATDLIQGTSYNISGRVVVNATGCDVDEIRRIDNPAVHDTVVNRKMLHVVIPALLNNNIGIASMNDDVYITPWKGKLLIGIVSDDGAQRSLSDDIKHMLSKTQSLLSNEVTCTYDAQFCHCQCVHVTY